MVGLIERLRAADDVQGLRLWLWRVRAGLLTFGPEPQPSVLPSAKERPRERCRRYRARKREQRGSHQEKPALV
jgi:hypothetical protein